jgi:hypothetical protein
MLHVEGVVGLVTCGIVKTVLFVVFGTRVRWEVIVVGNPWDEMRWD